VSKEALKKLRAVPLFEELSNKDLSEIYSSCKVGRFEPGRDVVVEGKGGIGFHLVLEGKALIRHGDKTVATLGPGDYFGEISMIDGGERTATVTAETNLSTLSLSTWDFKPLLEKPSIAKALLLKLAARIRQLEKSQAL
jgi:CRP/FNR family cyclic AMP-dependent transcriptional regulator